MLLMKPDVKHQIATILDCSDSALIEKVELAIANFNQLDLTQKYHIAFSGGKDSHALLIVFLLWKQINNIDTSNFIIKFADTRLETPKLYNLIENIEVSLKDVQFERVLPEHSYWYYQFVIGYPVPDWRIRWCTLWLKIAPMKATKTKDITGRHFGESIERDNRLSSCSTGECGIDKIKFSVDPILHFRNCDVWELVFYADNTVLYQGVFNALQATYSISTDEKGSLRMGCFMCPVAGQNSILNDPERSKYGLNFRLLLEKLRKCRRINSPRTKKKGAIYIVDRRKIWQELDKETLIKLGYITKQEIKEINLLIQKDSYPKSYTQEWINSEHKRLKSETIFTDLPLFKGY
jgi:3'-phosphoadenosine 5'-phosphosulfate sulfotransferase (PAPS reductase)/FAD synthetase